MAKLINGKNDANGGFDYLVSVDTFNRRAKRKGRNPSTGAFETNSTTNSVNRQYCLSLGAIGSACVHIAAS